MGADSPRKIGSYQSPLLDLQSSCKLLLVSPMCPENETALMFERVLKSIKLSLDDALYLEPSRVSSLGEHELEWVWFAGCEVDASVNAKQLTSPLLKDIDGNNEQRRALWQQICSYS